MQLPRDSFSSFAINDCTVEHSFNAGAVTVAILEWAADRDGRSIFSLDQNTLLVNLAPVGGITVAYETPIATSPRNEGELSFFPAGYCFERSIRAGRYRAIICTFDNGALVGYDPTFWSERELLLSLDLRNVFLQEAVIRIARELKHSRLGSDQLIDALCRMLTIEVPRHLALMDWAADPPPDRLLALQQINLINERIRAPGTQMPAADELAHLCGISVRQLSRLFRRTMGITVGHYVSNQRISMARRALTDNANSVKAVAFECGFSSVSAFSVAFRRETGLTPGQFRLIASHSSRG